MKQGEKKGHFRTELEDVHQVRRKCILQHVFVLERWYEDRACERNSLRLI